MNRQSGLQKLVKVLLDRLAGTAGLVLAAPVMAVVALIVRVTMGAPVLFAQERPGYRARFFTLYKFRTMANAVDAQGRLLSDEKRLTAVGRILRATSLDELPQLWNVARGDLSLVGPRPLLTRYLPRYSPEQMRRHDVLPGITGWAQIHGRNAVTWDQKFELDVWYVDHWTLLLDLRILLLTLRTVVTREGVSHPGMATMSEFGADAEERDKEIP